MSLTYYRFRDGMSVFCKMPTETAARLLPGHLRPLEVQHGAGIFAVTVFDFLETPVGPYRELVLAVVVPPLAKSDGQFPKAAFYPILLATTTPESREHAIARWHLPHYPEDVRIMLREEAGRMDVYVYESEEPVLDFRVTRRKWNPVEQLYQSFMVDAEGRFKVDLHMRGRLSVHEEERGFLKLYDHPLFARLDTEDIDAIPFRELWMKDGTQVFEEIQSLEAL